MAYRILIAVTDSACRQALRDAFTGEYALAEVENGRDALCMLQTPGEPFGAVLADARLPDMDGLALLKETRASTQTRRVPVLLVCPPGCWELGENAVPAGCDDYITRPVNALLARRRVEAAILRTYGAPPAQVQPAIRDAISPILSSIMRSPTELSFAKDKNLVYLCCSRAFANMVGLKNEADVAGKTDFDLFADRALAEQYRADDLRLMRSADSFLEHMEPIPSGDGLQRYSLTSKYVLRDESGNPIGLYGTGRDVTEYRTAFEQLKLLTDNLPGGLATYALSAQGIKLLYFNDGLCKMFGCNREEYALATKDSVITTVFPEDIPRLQAQIQRMIVEGTPVNCTYRIRNMKNSGYKWINLRATNAEMVRGVLQAHAVLYDVTEQKQAEEAALLHEKEMRLVIAQMGKTLCEYNPQTRTLTVPEAYAARYAMPVKAEDIPESLIRDGRILEHTQEIYRSFFAAILKGEKFGTAEFHVRYADGTLHWERVEFSTIFDSDHAPVKSLITVEDTTRRHAKYELEQARPTLGEKNLLVHALINLSTGETLDYADSSGRAVPACERTAFTPENSHLENIIANAEEREKFSRLNQRQALLSRFHNGETELSIDYRRTMPRGDRIWVRNLLRMVRNPDGDDILLFEYCYDIEEEKTRELMYKALVKDNYDYVARVNGKNGHFVIIANAGVQYGIPPESGQDISAVSREIAARYIHPEDRENLIAHTSLEGIKKDLETTDRYQFIFRLIRPDGEVRHKKLNIYYLDRAREIIIAAREDVSNVMRSETQKNEQLTNALSAANQASRAKSQFLSRMSHELRTPMNAIIGLSALSASEIEDPRAMRDSISKIGMSARYLLSLINDILEMSRIESGRMTLTEVPFDFEKLIADVNAIIFAQAQGKGIDYDAIVNGFTEGSYVGDATKLQQILINVLGNAIKFTPAGGRVTLSIQQRRRTKKGAVLRFVVADTGIGIDEAFLPHLFDLFTQESGEITSIATGTGLGLAITKNLVEMMNGRISVNSIKHMGSEFTIDVELGVTNESRNYMDMVSGLKLEKLRVLVVDDDVVICKSTGDILKSMGMQAMWASSGAEAVECVRQARAEANDFSTIFVDLRMPDMDGIETARRIRQIVGKDVTIIIITAYDWQEIEAEARAAGVDMFMEKPLFQSSIIKAFERVFMTNRAKVEPEAKPAPIKDMLAGRRILLAEDHPLNVEVAKRLLEKAGAAVVVANNGLEALEMFAASPKGEFDAILMDIRMPEMDGLTAARNIRKLRKEDSKTIPIIAMTANAFDEDVELSLASGMNAHLAKPIEPQLLFSTLLAHIRRAHASARA